MSFVVFVLLTLCCGWVQCRLQNISIDDTNGDPTTSQFVQYNPTSSWSLGTSCNSCEAQFNSSEAYEQTWHDTTFLPGGPMMSASVNFTGSAVYVVCILTGSTENPNGNSDMTFLIDNNTAGVFQQSPDGNSSYSFNHVVFAAENLTMDAHNLTLLNGLSGEAALVLLDRIIYTIEVPDEQPSTVSSQPMTTTISTPNTPLRESNKNTHFVVVVATSVSGSVIFTIAVAATVYHCRRRKRSLSSGVRLDLDPWEGQAPANVENQSSVQSLKRNRPISSLHVENVDASPPPYI
ncbi:hypothetical protein SCHPADRAFT_935980 [Schizopora paradoxa]|uniref:Uncharacterized protein n=1 Tax=Schizopora paradoxa TaxID=27342 RepID=A0A0H2S338_9AGAM|nr:hypothetical protein SCHPADRAFT_935980 [Schizopora paradoxa]